MWCINSFLHSDVGGNDKGIFRVLADGSTFADGPYAGSGADYAEWFEKEGDLKPKDLVGLNVKTGKVRRYQPGDPLIGVISVDPILVGNRLKEKSEEDMERDFVVVSLVGQVEIDSTQIQEKSREVLTPDGQRIGYRLASGRVLLRIEK